MKHLSLKTCPSNEVTGFKVLVIRKACSTRNMVYFIHLFNKYLLNAYDLPGTDVDIGNKAWAKICLLIEIRVRWDTENK